MKYKKITVLVKISEAFSLSKKSLSYDLITFISDINFQKSIINVKHDLKLLYSELCNWRKPDCISLNADHFNLILSFRYMRQTYYSLHSSLFEKKKKRKKVM